MRRPSVLRSLVLPARGTVRFLVLLARRTARFDLTLLAFLAAQPVFGLGTVHAQAAKDAGAPDSATSTGSAPEEATPAAEPAAEPSEPAAPAEAEPETAAPSEGPAPVLEPPSLTPLELDTKTTGPTAAAAEAKPASVPEKKGWTAPETMFQLHGYLRLRAGLLNKGWLGHTGEFDRLQTPEDGAIHKNYDPFTYFRSYDSQQISRKSGEMDNSDEPVRDGCGDSPGEDGSCGKKNQVGGDMRFRLKPEIHLSDDIRVKAWIDIMDNVGLGTMGYGANNFNKPDSVDLGNAIRVRRAWGEARNRDIGELRFGRMGADWGLGILDNGGDRNGIDSDFSSDVDRIMGMTNLGGFYFMAAYDWASQGKLLPAASSPSGVPLDRAQRDDYSAVTGSIVHKLDADVQRATLQRGEAVFNYGAYFVWRRQILKDRVPFPSADVDEKAPFYRLDQTQYIPDLWAQFLWEGLRIEIEGTYVAGSLEGGCPVFDAKTDEADMRDVKEGFDTHDGDPLRDTNGSCKFRQFGLALEAEYRLFDDRLGVFFLSGLASGDSNAYGLAQTNDASLQRSGNGDRQMSTFQFNPDYRIDLIMWRTLMRRVAGAYYFKPGVSYDFIHDAYGQQAGARIDAIYSRATNASQTWGRDANLGLELDLSLYYRSEDGPDIWDGFYGLVQFGILFPFQGLDYASGTQAAKNTSSTNAIIFRGVTGIQF